MNDCDQETEPNLGGKLLYAGELDVHGQAMAIAGNVSGCATLGGDCGIDDAEAGYSRCRRGFCGTSLDEALRILKNEVRKRATVSGLRGVVRLRLLSAK